MNGTWSAALPCDANSCGEAGIPRWKRCLDYLCILALLPGLLLLFALVAAVILIVSRGPVLFRQRRIGYLGRPFTLYKFRTMRTDADIRVHQQYTKKLIRSQQPMVKLDDYGDPRLIPGGAFLRASGLDELPQVLNVVLGQMSLVGPRPCMPEEYAELELPGRARCNVLPGLTGLWQVSGKNDVTFAEMVELDLRYVRECSLGLDLWIMLKTLPVLVRQVRRLGRPGPQLATPPINGKVRALGTQGKTVPPAC